MANRKKKPTPRPSTGTNNAYMRERSARARKLDKLEELIEQQIAVRLKAANQLNELKYGFYSKTAYRKAVNDIIAMLTNTTPDMWD